jgi:unsaturated rhamnogalacturonyl hydrolase
MNLVLRTALFLSLLFTAIVVHAQPDYFNNWPPQDSPQEIGKRVAEHFVTSPHQGKGTIVYSEVGTWYGALTFAELTHDDALHDELIQRFQSLLPGGTEADKIPKRDHVDDSIFGVVPLQIYMETKDKKYLDDGLGFADRQWENPQPDGLSHETRYWVDDMYMLTMLQLEAYRATGDKKYLDRDAREMVAYLDKLQQPNGLFYHLPADHPDRARILKGYQLMMLALVKYQAEDGMWRQLIDHPEAWEESSSSGMFTFALITGVKNGWLDRATYGPAARKGWIAVTGFIDQNDNVTNVCEGTNKFNSLDYYLQRKRRTGDFHAQETILWAASALLR